MTGKQKINFVILQILIGEGWGTMRHHLKYLILTLHLPILFFLITRFSSDKLNTARTLIFLNQIHDYT